jgi:hypothetical protein
VFKHGAVAAVADLLELLNFRLAVVEVVVHLQGTLLLL